MIIELATFAALSLGSNQLTSVNLKSQKTVVAFLSSRCPCSESHEKKLADLAQKYSKQGFQFIGIHSNQNESIAEAQQHFKKSPIQFSVLHDDKARLANIFRALKTPHVFVLSEKQEVLYAGGVDDSRDVNNAKQEYLANALQAIVEHKPIANREVKTLGCAIVR